MTSLRRTAWGLPGAVGLLWLAASCAQGALANLPDGSVTTVVDARPEADAKRGQADTGGGQADAASEASPLDASADAGTDGGSADSSVDARVSDASDASHHRDGPSDAKHPVDASADTTGDATDAATCPTGTTGPSCDECATGYHICGTTCAADQPNDPSVGCSMACSTGACAAPSGEVASCTDAGLCVATCGSGMKLCTTGNCAACCVNADCPANVECNGGACNECLPGYGTCSALCDTNLTTSKNCGTCGKVCTVNNLLCLATGAFCGCKGDASAGYSCT